MLVVSGFILWIGCLLVYVASPHQKLLERSLSKVVSYPVFITLIIISWLGFSQEHTPVIAGLVVLVLMMVMWPVIVFMVSHIKSQFMPYLVGGGLFFSLLSLLGTTT
jgi:hypothetical protein